MKAYILAVQIPASICSPKFDPDAGEKFVNILVEAYIVKSSMIRHSAMSHATNPPRRSSTQLFLSSLIVQVEELHHVGSQSSSILLRRFASLGEHAIVKQRRWSINTPRIWSPRRERRW